MNKIKVKFNAGEQELGGLCFWNSFLNRLPLCHSLTTATTLRSSGFGPVCVIDHYIHVK